MPEFIYSMHNVRKALGDKVVLDNITLSFYPGAKIGVVGPNGTGKSTLLKLMAGIEKPNNGDAMLAKDATVGILLQEPPLTEGKTVLENVEEGVADIKALQARMDELGVAMGEPDADFDQLMAEMGEVQTELDRRNAWDIDSQLEQAMDALRCPPPDAMAICSWGGTPRALCKLLLQQPDLLLLDEPTNHLDAESVSGWRVTGRRIQAQSWRDARSILPGKRGAMDLDSTAADPPVRGQLLHLLDTKKLGSRSRVAGMPSVPRSWNASWSGHGPTRGTAGQEQAR